MLERGLHLERTGDSLIVRSTNRQRWVGALFAAFAVIFLVAIARKPPGNDIGRVVSVLMALAFFGFGLFATLLREVRTIFDCRSRRIVHTLTVGSYQRRREYSFADVASVGVREFYSDGYSYMPVVRLPNGETRWLGAANYGYLSCARVVDEICRATGLIRRDIPYRGWWRSSSDRSP
jgi:hypothetical protein